MCLNKFSRASLSFSLNKNLILDRENVSARSVSSSQKVLGNGDHVLLAVSGVLGLTIAHWHVFTPDTDENGLGGFGNAGTTTSLSGENAVLDSIVLMVDHEHVLLVADSNSAVLSSLSVSVSGLHDSGVLVAWNLLGSSIFLWHVELVGCELESWRHSPCVSVVTVQASELAHVGDGPSISFCVKSVLNLMTGSESRKEKFLVDGQQRITTIMLTFYPELFESSILKELKIKNKKIENVIL